MNSNRKQYNGNLKFALHVIIHKIKTSEIWMCKAAENKGAKVWLPHSKTVWQSGTLEENYQAGVTEIVVGVENGDMLIVPVKPDGSDLPPLRKY
uniref:Myosin N-terminal SH3-like domain-containing protein n=1 Tax=Glossina pallidipes TaxID=7398 RepID=A0A1A9ZX80_GLOPL